MKKPDAMKTQRKVKTSGPAKDADDCSSPLRRKAEEKLAERLTESPAINSNPVEKIVHELQVHQIELEMQNEALREAHYTLEESRDKYSDLYEFAPVGYLTLTKKTTIEDGNLTSATILGIGKQKLIKSPFSKFVVSDDLGRWEHYFITVLRNSGKQVCELKLRKGDGSIINARIESVRMLQADKDPVVRMAVSDITDRLEAEAELKKKNTDLNALNEELTATQEELQQNIDDLTKNEAVLRQNEEKLKQALTEKEVLLSEIHHRVKNNLTAFISLLSLEGSYEETPAGKALKKDLQNRARSMALIHETLYKTHKFDEVDMMVYMSTLVEQVVNSYNLSRPIRIVVEAQGIMLDLARATPTGLIVNEIVTNSLKYAFPDGEACLLDKNHPCTIRVSLIKEDSMYTLRVSDNGIGLPPAFDITTTRTLGLKLVNFLARHQMRAKVEVKSNPGTEFIFRFRE